MNSESQLNPRIIQVVQRQALELIRKPTEGIKYVLNEVDILDIQADIVGPVETPYHNGVYRCKLSIPAEFPKNPPKGYFLTKIFHPNVSEKGEICVNTLKKDWDPANWSLKQIFEVIRCLLIVPFPESALNDEAGKLFMEDYEEYHKHASMIRDLYAMPTSSNQIKEEIKNTSFDMNKSPSPKKESSMENTKFMMGINNNCTFNSNHKTNSMGFHEVQPTKENVSQENPLIDLKNEKNSNSLFNMSSNPDDVLTTVTNSVKTSNSQGILFQKSASSNAGGTQNNFSGLMSQNNSNPLNQTSFSAKKENDKKVWRKRI